MKQTPLILAFLLFCILPAVKAQDICFEHIDNNNGLSQNTVQAIIQDRDGFLWFGTKNGLNRFDGEHFKTFKHIPGSEEGLGNSQVRCLEEDSDGNIWIGTNSGLYIYKTTEGIFESKTVLDTDGNEIPCIILIIKRGPDGSMWVAIERLGIYRMRKGETELKQVFKSGSPIRSLEVDQSSGTIWFSWSGNGLFYTEDGFKTYLPYCLEDGSRIFPADIISSILISGFNKIYLGLEGNGALELNKATRKIKRLDLGEKSVFVRNMMQYSPEELWIGTEAGIYIWDINSETSRHLEYSPYDKWSLSDNAIHALLKDRDGGIWVGTFFGGINYLPHRTPFFSKYYNNGSEDCFKGRRVRRLCPDKEDNIWVATEDAGLFLFNPKDGKFRHLSESREFSNIQALLLDGDDLWIGTFSKGIKRLNTKTSKIHSYKSVKEPGPRLFSNNIFALAKSSSGKIWVGTMHGLQFYDRETDGFGYVPEINGGKMVNDILEDSKGNLWVGTLSNGLYLLRNNSKQWKQFLSGHTSSGSIPGNSVNNIYEDSKGNVWVSVYGNGICRWNPESEDFTTLNSLNGLPCDVIYQIAEDDSGYLWLSSNNGLILINPNDYNVEKVFTIDDGLLSNQFNGNSFCKDSDGTMYFGSIEGLVSLKPMELRWKMSNQRTPKIAITDFFISGANATSSHTGKKISDTESIVLEHDQNTFSIQISSLTFSENIRIAFQMKGYDNSWREYDGGMITYTIPPGEYVFCAKLKDHPDIVKNVHITIRPPWWNSNTAKTIYIMLALVLLVASVYLIYRQQLAKRDKYIKSFELAKEKEVYDTKIAFFTNITHEIRTPLTLIKGPLENVLSKGSPDPAILRDLTTMKKNTDRLLSLVNQLLDFQKIEKENLHLELSCENIPELLEEIVGRFSDAIAYQNKKCQLKIVERDILAMVNKESLTKIISNLLTNAMKYSCSRIDILLHKEGNEFLLKISNDGPIVPLDKRIEIFSQFYRYTNTNGQSGTGIGLYLSKSLAELQHGKLEMTDNPDANEFVLRIPLYDGDMPKENCNAETAAPDLSGDRPASPISIVSEDKLILIVEDDPELCCFIKESLSDKWQTVAASNGKEALEILENENVNIIVSDIMMPQMDGIELCRIVRNDIRFTHIPLVLLTAKTTLESKIEGMNVGADAYIEKPFSMQYLVSVIANLLKNRQQILEAFLKNPLSTISSSDISSGDSRFLERLQEIVNENLSNSKFGMDDIAEMMNMSRANFYRKIKGVLDISPNDYLKMERLRQAAKLLVEKDLSISEICYMVGFRSPSYFTKCFHIQFGMHPKDFVSSLQKNNE